MTTTTYPLHSGDHLTRDEFERRYWQMETGKAELIDGIVFTDPRTSAAHGDVNALVNGWLGIWTIAAGRELLRSSCRPTVRIDDRNEPQPDACLHHVDHPTEDGFLSGTPPFIAEVAYSSASLEHHSKKRLYERTGCREYLVVTLEPFDVHWFVNENGAFQRLLPENGILRSRVFPGLELDVDALQKLDGRRLLVNIRSSTT